MDGKSVVVCFMVLWFCRSIKASSFQKLHLRTRGSWSPCTVLVQKGTNLAWEEFLHISKLKWYWKLNPQTDNWCLFMQRTWTPQNLNLQPLWEMRSILAPAEWPFLAYQILTLFYQSPCQMLKPWRNCSSLDKAWALLSGAFLVDLVRMWCVLPAFQVPLPHTLPLPRRETLQQSSSLTPVSPATVDLTLKVCTTSL